MLKKNLSQNRARRLEPRLARPPIAALALVASLGLHALAWLLIPPRPHEPRREKPPIELEVITQPDPSARPRDLAAPSSARSENPGAPNESPAQPRNEVEPTESTEPTERASPAATSPGIATPSPPNLGAPRRTEEPAAPPDLFAPGAVERGADWTGSDASAEAQPDASGEEGESAEARLDRLLAPAGAPLKPGPRRTPAIRAIATRLQGHFAPPIETLRNSRTRARKAFADRVLNYMKQTPRDDVAVDSWLLDTFGKSGLRADRGGWACISGCTSSHVVARLAVIVEVRHAGKGELADAQIKVSSGYSEFDAAALSAVKETYRFGSPDAMSIDPDVKFTHWAFEAEVFRYRRDELLLDPQFEPPGSRIEENLGTVYSAKTYIRLVAVGR